VVVVVQKVPTSPLVFVLVLIWYLRDARVGHSTAKAATTVRKVTTCSSGFSDVDCSLYVLPAEPVVWVVRACAHVRTGSTCASSAMRVHYC
jgi:hypothetical protein